VDTYAVEITGWDSWGESCSDEGRIEAASEDEAFEKLLNLMRARWDFTEVGDVRVRKLGKEF
jgi:hypothetical protein